MMRRVRCAIYTRKSSEEGLEQDFNSLDAQREACEAYIASQRHEGWELVPDHFDDGGISGGHMDRPALQRLMEAIDQKQVDQIVVYKIDRLTRSLADFAKLVDRLDNAQASFVSVTQSFNTSTSMGRLTLNVLLSFAQFEREVTAERIRDKIAASKRKGLWMGGNVPLGYDPDGRTLKINEVEAVTVKRIYALYEEHQAINKVRDAAASEGLRSKLTANETGQVRGGNVMSRGHLHHILTNPIYAGRIRHKGQVFEGQHLPLIDPSRWEKVQNLLSTKAPNKATGNRRSQNRSPLAGKIVDEAGEPLTPSHTSKAGKRYRYYVSRHKIEARKPIGEGSGWRLPAGQVEGLVANAVLLRLDHEAKQQLPPEPFCRVSVDPFELIKRVSVTDGSITIELTEVSSTTIDVPFTMRRRGVETKLIIAGQSRELDAKLIANIAQALKWYDGIKAGQSFDVIAKESGTSKRRVQQMIDLAFLAPDIIRDVLNGRQPMGFTSDWCLRHESPSNWQDQRVLIKHL